MRPAPERFPYRETTLPGRETSRLPYLPLTLGGLKEIEVYGLLDSGSSVNVLPLDVGIAIGADWDEINVTVTLTGNLSNIEAKVLLVTGKVMHFPPVRLAFAWVKSNDIPLILGQVNFFNEFDVCFFGAESSFEVRPKNRAIAP